MPEEEKYTALKEAMANNELPKQLKKLINNSNDRALIVESSKTGDEKYYHSVMKRFLDILDGIPVPYNNPYFLHFARLVEKSCQVAYKAVLQDKQSLDELETKTQDLFQSLQSTGKEVTVAQEEFIEHLHKIADVIDGKIYSLGVTVAAGLGAAALDAGFTAILVSVGLIPLTFGAITFAGALVVAAGGVGAATIPPFVKWREKCTKLANAQNSYEEAFIKMEELYQLYQKIMQEIQRDTLGHNHPEVHDLLFAHLAGVHIHGAKAKGDELCATAAESLTVYYGLRKKADKQFKPGNKLNSGSLEASSLSVSFNLLARDCDVAYTVEASVQDSQASQKSEEGNSQILKECITTLEKEMQAILELGNIHK
jgi:hypothetical protein